MTISLRGPPPTDDFFAGGSGDEQTLRANVEVWGRVRLRPPLLLDDRTRDLSTTRA
jgi:isopentenyl diphosphate isomerase/L-lactate dehydrogenase-like FMN-dependent dehydrogenase